MKTASITVGTKVRSLWSGTLGHVIEITDLGLIRIQMDDGVRLEVVDAADRADFEWLT